MLVPEPLRRGRWRTKVRITRDVPGRVRTSRHFPRGCAGSEVWMTQRASPRAQRVLPVLSRAARPPFDPSRLHRMAGARRPSGRFRSREKQRIMGNRLYVGNLSFSTTQAAIETAFAAAGEVREVAMPTDRETGQPR